MPTYTYAPAPVLVETTGEFAIGATGVFRATESGPPVNFYDLNDSPLATISVGPKGAHQAFKADIPYGILDFGSVLLPSMSIQQQEAALTASTKAQEAVDTADLAKEDATNALEIALSAGKYIIHGTNASTPRTAAIDVPLIWFGTVDPTNMIDGFDLWVNPTGGGGGSGIVTLTTENAPAGALFGIKQNADGSWPNRRSGRPDIYMFWLRIVPGSADPAPATSPSLAGAYATDVVLGA